MGIKVELLSEKNEEKWEEFVSLPNNAGVWHTLKWERIIEKEYGFKPYYLLAIDGVEAAEFFHFFRLRA